MRSIINNILTAIVVILLLLVLRNIYFVVKYEHFDIHHTTPKLSRIDNLSHRVHYSHKSPQTAADLLAFVNGQIIELLRHLTRKYPNSSLVTRLLDNYSPDNIVENSPLNPQRDTSFTLEKGKIVALCLRNKDGSFHSKKILTFVALHEVAHIAAEEYGHTNDFWEIFKFLLVEAADAGLLIPENFSNNPQTYCGISVNYNPYYDDNLKSIRTFSNFS